MKAFQLCEVYILIRTIILASSSYSFNINLDQTKKEYVIRTLNLPVKSISRIGPKPRNTTTIEKQESASLISVPPITEKTK